MHLGGIFVDQEVRAEENHYFATKRDPKTDDLRYLMSGRCAIDLVLQDLLHKHPEVKTCLLPAYTCETVVAPFIKEGFRITYYDLDDQLRPLPPSPEEAQVDVVLLCHYFGFQTYDDAFLKSVLLHHPVVIEDATHNLFSEAGFEAHAHYVAGSFRKWCAISCGGFALVRQDRFQIEPTPINEEHLRLRQQIAKDYKREPQKGEARFWEAELQLRSVFGAQASDDESIDLIHHLPLSLIKEKRRANYQAYLDNWQAPALTPLFPTLPDGIVPSHFPLRCRDRNALKATLLERGIRASLFWPRHPGMDTSRLSCDCLYDQLLCLPCDQRMDEADVRYICASCRDLA